VKKKKGNHYHQGIFLPLNVGKWRGDIKNICYRSGWELKMCRKFDLHENILEVASETIVLNGEIIHCLPYFNPVKQRPARYFVDFWIRYVSGNGDIKQAIIEVKPYAQTQPPVLSKTKTGRNSQKRLNTYHKALATFAVNMEKWKAAKKFANANGMHFFIVTEKDMKNFLR
jgi:hypothetical protein